MYHKELLLPLISQMNADGKSIEIPRQSALSAGTKIYGTASIAILMANTHIEITEVYKELAL